jgi:hypothetical protein
MDVNAEEKTSYTRECEEEFFMYVQNKYCAKRRRMSFITVQKYFALNHFPLFKGC